MNTDMLYNTLLSFDVIVSDVVIGYLYEITERHISVV